MKKLVFSLLFGFPVLLYSQINTRTGGSINVLPNSPTTNTNVGIGTNAPKSKLDVEGNVSIGTGYSGSMVAPINGVIIEGSVGIGTSNPTEKLEVVGNLKANTGYFDKALSDGQVFSSWEDRNIQCQVLTAGKLTDINWQAKTFNYFDFPVSNFNPYSEVFFSLSNRNTVDRLSFNAEQGNGGMFRLFDKNGQINFKFNDNGNDNVFLELPKQNSRIVISGQGNYLPEHKFVVRGSSMIEGNILTDSNIGIGTNLFADGSDSYRLSVNGAVRAHRVKVYTTWADFVFEKEYQLPTLKEVEKHIQEKGHLKDIPSAKEVEQNGIELGEMNKLLLQKVEELTLYLIEMNKELEEVKVKLNNIRNEK